MYLSDLILKLERLREDVGDVPVVIERERTKSGKINVFEGINVEKLKVVTIKPNPYETGYVKTHYIATMSKCPDNVIWVH